MIPQATLGTRLRVWPDSPSARPARSVARALPVPRVLAGRGFGFAGFALFPGTSLALTTMRWAAEPLGWHAVSVSSASGVLPTTHTSVGATVNQGKDTW